MLHVRSKKSASGTDFDFVFVTCVSKTQNYQKWSELTHFKCCSHAKTQLLGQTSSKGPEWCGFNSLNEFQPPSLKI
jgi:hypothetical protein